MWILELLFAKPVTIEWMTVTLPLTGTGARVLLASLGLAAGTGLVWLMLNAPDRPSKRRDLLTDWLTALGWALLPVWFVLLGGTLWHLWLLFSGMESFLDDVGFGMGAVVAAFLGGPFVIWGAVLKHRTVEFQKEGHITDRISKAVEQLGAEKTVKDAEGERTVRNIEVRIGGLLSLERIAQDSTRYDKGRDHVRVMEILCAYVRENAPAREAKESLRERWAQNHEYAEFSGSSPLSVEQFLAEDKLHPDKHLHNFDDLVSVESIGPWAQSLPEPRADIALALRIIGRRDADQLRVEARWGPEASDTDEWVFDSPCPKLPDPPEDQRHPEGAIKAYKPRLEAWTEKLANYRGYNPDLRNTNLQKADLSKLTLSGAILNGARMEGAVLSEARMEGANLSSARMEGAYLREAQMEGANLSSARMERAYLTQARMEGARLWQARMEGAVLSRARMDASTSLTDADVSSAAVREVDFSNVALSQEQINAMFGDGSVSLPKGRDRPTHWPRWELPFFGDLNFDDEWHKWRDNPEGYKPPDPPE